VILGLLGYWYVKTHDPQSADRRSLHDNSYQPALDQTNAPSRADLASPTEPPARTAPPAPTELAAPPAPLTPTEPTAPPVPLTSETPPSSWQGSPEAAVIEYWRLVNHGDFAHAWGLLSDNFRAIAHPGGLEDYEAGNKDLYCEIHVSNVSRKPDADMGANTASVVTELAVTANPACRHQESRTYEITLVREDESSDWMIERVAKPAQ
jgi:hypothetical protein